MVSFLKQLGGAIVFFFSDFIDLFAWISIWRKPKEEKNKKYNLNFSFSSCLDGYYVTLIKEELRMTKFLAFRKVIKFLVLLH